MTDGLPPVERPQSDGAPDLADETDQAPDGEDLGEDCLLLVGEGLGPAGSYRPTGFELTGSGTDQGADRFAHLHEAHHAALNDTTAWGSALHVTARVPGLGEVFKQLLRNCRRVHETFATTAPLAMLAEHHRELADYVRNGYPAYWRMYEAAQPLVTAAKGQNRQYLLATQYARVCMQTPILDDVGSLVETGSGDGAAPQGRIEEAGASIRLTLPRARDTPDGRWLILLRTGPELARAAAQAADEACTAMTGGQGVLALDHSVRTDRVGKEGHLEVLDPAHDSIWAAWETTCYDVLADALRARGCDVLDLDGHQEPTRVVVDAVVRLHPGIGLGAALGNGTARDDQQVAGAILEQARHIYSTTDSWAATARPLADEAVEDLVRDPARIEGAEVIVIDARPAHRLARLYDWEDGASGRPVGDGVWVTVRRVRAGESGSRIEHTVLKTTNEAERLLDAWEHDSRPVVCISASSLANEAWVAQWWPVLSTRCVPFVLLDVEAARVTPGWIRAQDRGAASQLVESGSQSGLGAGPDPNPKAKAEGAPLLMGRVEVNDTGGLRHVVAMRPSLGQPVWLSVHDDLGASVFMQALRGTPGLAVESTAEHLEALADEIRVVLTHLLATEPFFDAGGLSGRV